MDSGVLTYKLSIDKEPHSVHFKRNLEGRVFNSPPKELIKAYKDRYANPG